MTHTELSIAGLELQESIWEDTFSVVFEGQAADEQRQDTQCCDRTGQPEDDQIGLQTRELVYPQRAGCGR